MQCGVVGIVAFQKIGLTSKVHQISQDSQLLGAKKQHKMKEKQDVNCIKKNFKKKGANGIHRKCIT